MSEPAGIIEALGMQAHPEGGWYVETWRDTPEDGGRGAGTAILYLLQEGERSRRHRIDAVEIWHFHDGDPLELLIEDDAGGHQVLILGRDLAAGQRPQVIVPGHAWQSARPLGAWTLVGCTVSPAFEFSRFELAEEA